MSNNEFSSLSSFFGHLESDGRVRLGDKIIFLKNGPMIKDLEEIQVKLIAKNGINAQVDVLLEEMSELTKVLLKRRRGLACREDVLEEIADVYLTLGYAVKLIDHDDLENFISLKFEKMKQYLND